MSFEPRRALELLRIGTNLEAAEFREGQEEAIRHIVEGRGRLLVVQKTGWGKSFVYFIAAKLLRDLGKGPSLLVSPLLSLMRNQLRAAASMGVEARTIHSGNEEEWEDVESAVTADRVDILLIAPERLSNPRFRANVLSRIGDQVAMLVIDEAHCISDWGHDFRPHYRLIERVVRAAPSNLRILATTATANDRVMQDLSEILGPDLHVIRGDLARPSLKLQTMRLRTPIERLAWLAQYVPLLPGHGIIYTLTVRDAERVASWLRTCGLAVEAYHAKKEPGVREQLEEALLANQVKALVATTSLGMGYDKPDLSFVVHYQTPGSVVAYYQQVGRAGRQLDAAYGILASGLEEEDINTFFVESAFPSRDEVHEILSALEEAPDGLSVPELQSARNISKGRIDKTLLLLSLESPAPITKVGAKWQLTTAELSNGFWERATRLSDLRKREQAQMQEYVDLTAGHMEFLIRALDGDPGDSRSPVLPRMPTNLDATVLQRAAEFLERTSYVIAPRKRWPPDGLSRYDLRGNIARELQALPGLALCTWGDPGFGERVSRSKYENGHFDDELLQASLRHLERWFAEEQDVPPEWVTFVPSLRHPELVRDFARRIADALHLPCRDSLEKTEARPEQKTMANGTQQARNVDGSLRVDEDVVDEAPVLLVDDLVD